MNAPLQKNEIHIAELDGLRGIAIIIVVFFHYWTMAIVPFGKASKLIIGFSSLFWSGVDLFFVLSGFLIGGILIRNKLSPNYFKTFYIRRFTRIFPIYFLSISLFFICKNIPFFAQIPDLINSPIPIWPFGLFIQNFFIIPDNLTPAWLVPTWSLAIEEQFYLCIPLIIFLFPPKKLPFFIAFIIVIAIGIKIYFGRSISDFYTPDRYIGLLLGILIAFFFNHKTYWNWMLTKKRIWSWISILVFVLGVWIIKLDKYNIVFVFVWLALFYSFILIMLLSNKMNLFSRFCNQNWLKTWGKYSYGIYIIHIPVFYLINFIIFNETKLVINDYSDLFKPIVSVLVTFLIAYISYNIFEKKCLNFGKQFNY
jgi:peptidoglycan/LPS O-acetylase OafA/YrhL